MPRRPPPEGVLARAAELRALGQNWDAIARELKRSARNIRRWPRTYAERWEDHLKDAQRRAIGDLAGESLNILRHLLRDADGRLRLGASAFLAELRLKQAKHDFKTQPETPIPPLALHIARILETYSHEDLVKLTVAVGRCTGTTPPVSRPELRGHAG